LITSALVIGFGSIGRRHFKILSSILGKDNVVVLSSQEKLPVNSINSLDKIPQDINYVVIANETEKHLRYLDFIVSNTDIKTILVEKPLFEDSYEFDSKGRSIYVGYNLRFHPLVLKLRSEIINQNVQAVYCFCHSYLPDWRKERAIKESYSSSSKGGGVVLDLSHEIDLLLWLFGCLEIDFVKIGNFSNLDIESEDSMLLSGHIENGSPVELSLSYFSAIERRQIHVVAQESTYIVDLVNNTIHSRDNSSQVSEYRLDPFDLNTTYVDQHNCILRHTADLNATLQDGLKVNSFIKKIKNWTKT